MRKNVSKIVLLFLPLAFLLASCTALQPVSKSKRPSYSNNRKPSNTQRKTTTTKETALRRNIVSYAKRWKGVKYKYGGKDPKGFDCSGFTSYVYRKFDLNITPSSKVQATKGRKIPLSRANAGDLVFFSKTGKGAVSHVAMVVSNEKEGLTVIHCTSSKGVMVQNVSRSNYWRPKMLYARNVIDY